jgi:hypothetical protein
MKPVDISGILGIGVNATKNLQAGVRLQLGLTNIFDKSSTSSDFPDVKNRVIHFFIGYSF